MSAVLLGAPASNSAPPKPAEPAGTPSSRRRSTRIASLPPPTYFYPQYPRRNQKESNEEGAGRANVSGGDKGPSLKGKREGSKTTPTNGGSRPGPTADIADLNGGLGPGFQARAPDRMGAENPPGASVQRQLFPLLGEGVRGGGPLLPEGLREWEHPYEVYSPSDLAKLGTCREPWGVSGVAPIHASGTECHQCRLRTRNRHSACSRCKGEKGRICGDCLYMQYGENLNEVEENLEWVCPWCRGICNCLFCRAKKCLTNFTIPYRAARARGFPSVAHYLITTLQADKIAAAEGSGTATATNAAGMGSARRGPIGTPCMTEPAAVVAASGAGVAATDTSIHGHTFREILADALTEVFGRPQLSVLATPASGLLALEAPVPETPALDRPAPRTEAPEAPAPGPLAPETPVLGRLSPEAAAAGTLSPEAPAPEVMSPEEPVPGLVAPEAPAPETPAPGEAGPAACSRESPPRSGENAAAMMLPEATGAWPGTPASAAVTPDVATPPQAAQLVGVPDTMTDIGATPEVTIPQTDVETATTRALEVAAPVAAVQAQAAPAACTEDGAGAAIAMANEREPTRPAEALPAADAVPGPTGPFNNASTNVLAAPAVNTSDQAASTASTTSPEPFQVSEWVAALLMSPTGPAAAPSASPPVAAVASLPAVPHTEPTFVPPAPAAPMLGEPAAAVPGPDMESLAAPTEGGEARTTPGQEAAAPAAPTADALVPAAATSSMAALASPESDPVVAAEAGTREGGADGPPCEVFVHAESLADTTAPASPKSDLIIPTAPRPGTAEPAGFETGMRILAAPPPAGADAQSSGEGLPPLGQSDATLDLAPGVEERMAETGKESTAPGTAPLVDSRCQAPPGLATVGPAFVEGETVDAAERIAGMYQGSEARDVVCQESEARDVLCQRSEARDVRQQEEPREDEEHESTPQGSASLGELQNGSQGNPASTGEGSGESEASLAPSSVTVGGVPFCWSSLLHVSEAALGGDLNEAWQGGDSDEPRPAHLVHHNTEAAETPEPQRAGMEATRRERKRGRPRGKQSEVAGLSRTYLRLWVKPDNEAESHRAELCGAEEDAMGRAPERSDLGACPAAVAECAVRRETLHQDGLDKHRGASSGKAKRGRPRGKGSELEKLMKTYLRVEMPGGGDGASPTMGASRKRGRTEQERSDLEHPLHDNAQAGTREKPGGGSNESGKRMKVEREASDLQQELHAGHRTEAGDKLEGESGVCQMQGKSRGRTSELERLTQCNLRL